LSDLSAAVGAAQDDHSPIPTSDAGGPASQVAELVAMLRAKDAIIESQRTTIADQARTIAEQARTIGELTARAAPPIYTATIREIFDAYEALRKGEGSWITIRNGLRPLVRRLGDLPAVDLTPKKWREHYQARIAEGNCWGRTPSPTTLASELGRAKTMLTWAASEDAGFIPSNPLRDAKRPKKKPPRKTWLPEPDIQRLLTAPEPRCEKGRAAVAAFVLVKADTGLRFNEVRFLRRDRVRRRGNDRVADIPQTKNDKPHVVGLTHRCFEALEALPRSLKSPYYFTNPDTDDVYAETTLRGWFYEACDSSGVTKLAVDGEKLVRPHDMRRSAATNAHARGASLLDIQDMLNHSNPGITAQYVQRNERNAVKIARLMEAGAEQELREAMTERRVGPRRSEGKTRETKIDLAGQA